MSENNHVINWPVDAANSVVFKVPESWRNKKKNANGNAEFCKLEYDAEERLVKVVDSNNPIIVLDVLDADDMIGASIEIRMTETSSSPPSRRETDDDNIRASNEPPTAALSDTQGSALLSIFMYPREDLSKKSSWKFWKSNAKQPQSPQPFYRRTVKSNPNEGGAHPRLGSRFAAHRKFVLQPVEDFTLVQSLVTAIRDIARTSGKSQMKHSHIQSTTEQRKRYLILVNPCSGPKRNGVSLCDEVVLPILKQAGIEPTVVVTTHARHAAEICARSSNGEGNGEKIEITNYDALVLIGGDGTIHEVLNGIHLRSDKDFVFKKLPIGVVGCGAGNGLASSLAYASQERFGAINEAFLIAKGRTEPFDISKHEVFANNSDRQGVSNQPNSTGGVVNSIIQYISFLTFSWAFVSDVDLESECISWMGASRFDIWAVWRIISLRKYRAKFSYRPATGGCNPTSSDSHTTPIVPALTEPVPDDWKVIDENIILIWASHITHASSNAFNAPASRLQDGIFQVMVLRGNVSRFRMLLILLAIESGHHVGMPGCEFIECSAYRLEPHPSDRNKSRNNIDGEAVESGIIQACAVPSALRVFCNP